MKLVAVSEAVITMVAAVMTANASAHGFIANKLSQGAVEGGTQTFVTAGGTIVCTKASERVEAAALKGEVVSAEDLQFGECEADGFAGAEATPMAYEWNADGKMAITKEMQFNVAGLCTVVFPGGQKELASMEYRNHVGGSLEIIANVTGITSSGVGFCSYSTESKGIYQGTLIETLESATLEWV